MLRPPTWTRPLLFGLPLVACSEPSAEVTASAGSSTTGTGSTTASTSSTSSGTTSSATESGASSTSTTGEVHEGALIVHSFGEVNLAPYKERFRCATWTIGNEEALYVNTVHLSNDGGFHHSNWFIVPDDLFPGDDGYFKCSDRGYTETIGVISGSVLFAQSTQSRYETQALPEGVVVKIPPRHKVIAEAHLLNGSSEPLASELRMGFDLVHPADVDVVVSPFRLNYVDLDIPAKKLSSNQATCSFAAPYQDFSGHPFDLKLYYGLPHYHYLGDHFFVDIVGGDRDGERIFELSGFNGDANGQVYDPPIDMSGAEGFRFGCGYNNWTDDDVGYGVGDQEMCTFLGFADAHALLDGVVSGGTKAVDIVDDRVIMEGPCGILTVPKTAAYSMPEPAELEGPLYVPPPGPGAGQALRRHRPGRDTDDRADPERPAQRLHPPRLLLQRLSRARTLRSGGRARPPRPRPARGPPGPRGHGRRRHAPHHPRGPERELALPPGLGVRADRRQGERRRAYAPQRADPRQRGLRRRPPPVDRRGSARQLTAFSRHGVNRGIHRSCGPRDSPTPPCWRSSSAARPATTTPPRAR